MLARQALLVDKFIHQLTTIGNHVKYVQVAININVLFWNIEFYQRMQMLKEFQKHGK
jgi:hypothetical protein